MAVPRFLLSASIALLLTACGDAPAPTTDAFPVPAWAKVAPEQSGPGAGRAARSRTQSDALR